MKTRIFKQRLYQLLVARNKYIENDFLSVAGEKKPTLTVKKILFVLGLNVKYRLLRRKNSLPYLRSSVTSHLNTPCLRGPESNLSRRPKSQHFAKKLLEYDVISFDIFDTLILRPIREPSDMFLFMENELNILGFSKKRIQVEQELRARKFKSTDGASREIKLSEIYDELALRTGVNPEYGMELELKYELTFCSANPYMLEVLEILKANNKPCIAISDMFFSREYIEKILAKNGLLQYLDRVYISCEFDRSKRDMGLYDIADKDYVKGRHTAHIGDHYLTDFTHAKNFGWDSFHYRSIHSYGKSHRANFISSLISSGYAGVINQKLHTTHEVFSPHYEFGYIYGGLFLYGYCNHIDKFAKSNNVDKILFLSRDGDALIKGYQKYFNSIPSQYCLWSRNPSRIISAFKNKSDYLKQYIHDKVGEEFTLSEVLESMQLSELKAELPNFSFMADSKLTSENAQIFEDFILFHWDNILSYYDNYKRGTEKYLRKVIGDAKHVLVVDIGWHGSSPMSLKTIIEDIYQMDCKVTGMLAATANNDRDYLTPMLMSGKINTYLFSPIENRELMIRHSKVRLSNVMMELFLTANHPSLRAISLDENDEIQFEFDIPEVENYKIIKDVQSGMLDFCEDYEDKFKSFPYMKNIPGRDAYGPIYHIIKDNSYIKKYFGKYRYNRLVGNMKQENMRRLDDILR
ncbi:HAD-IA family hydrolase [Vibrio cholerae]